MKKLTLLLVTLLSACSSVKDTEHSENHTNAVSLTALPCMYPDAPKVSAPSWICEQKIEGLTIQAMGMSDNQDAGIAHQRQLALLDAQTILATQLNNKVGAAIKNYSATKGSSNKRLVKKSSSSDLTSSLDTNVKQSTIYQSVRSPNNVYYVLVGLTEKAYQQNLQDKTKQAVANDDGWETTNSEQALVNDIISYVNQ